MLNQGKIQDGYKLLDRGRKADVFGNNPPQTPAPKWDGLSVGTILLYLEGGLGDQIHQIRYAKYIAEKGNKVVVCCTGSLIQMFSKLDYVTALVQHGAEYGVYHDYWVAGMSAIIPLGYELEDISGSPYINKPSVDKNKKFTIGLRWQGNPAFEHEHLKLFPPELLFEAVKDFDVEYISLQRDEGSQHCPQWVKQVPLQSWDDTQHAVSQCDLVISSCTSVSHLSAAMGVETWVITPILPYFLYALDGEKTPYYDSMKIIRQTVFESWIEPFEVVREKLIEKGLLKQ